MTNLFFWEEQSNGQKSVVNFITENREPEDILDIIYQLTFKANGYGYNFNYNDVVNMEIEKALYFCDLYEEFISRNK